MNFNFYCGKQDYYQNHLYINIIEILPDLSSPSSGEFDIHVILLDPHRVYMKKSLRVDFCRDVYLYEFDLYTRSNGIIKGNESN